MTGTTYLPGAPCPLLDTFERSLAIFEEEYQQVLGERTGNSLSELPRLRVEGRTDRASAEATEMRPASGGTTSGDETLPQDG